MPTTKTLTLKQIAGRAKVHLKTARAKLRRAAANKVHMPSSCSTTRWEFRPRDVPVIREIIRH